MNKKFFLSIIIIFIISIITFLCFKFYINKSTQENNIPTIESNSNNTTTSNKENSVQNTESNSNNNTPSNSTNKDNTSDKKNIFYGKWKIIKEVASNSVSALSPDDISNIIGRLIEFNTSSITYVDKTYSNVKYTSNTISADEFESGYKGVTFNTLGIKNTTINSISIETSDINGISEMRIFEKNKDTLILYISGVFFELHRQ